MLRVAVIGRPNVGKSSLFNRLTGTQHALVHDLPGVTRDRRYGEASLGDIPFCIIDTAGKEEGGRKAEMLQASMEHQADLAIEEADIVFFLFDAREGLTPVDEEIARHLRKVSKPTLLIGNKAEGMKFQSDYTSHKLGLGDPIFISTAHSEGMSDLFEGLLNTINNFSIDITKTEEENLAEKPLQLVIAGRPNAGKSTLVNAFLNEERQLAGPMAGLTRDSISIDWSYNGRAIKLVDTAGQRRRANVTGKLEQMSVQDALRSVQYAHVVALVVDATCPLEKQDLHLARKIIDEGRALIIIINKWDIAENKQTLMDDIEYEMKNHFAHISQVPLITISALKKTGLKKVMDAVFKVYDLWNTRLTTGQMNKWLEYVTSYHPPPLVNGRRVKLKYVTQIKTRPPTFFVYTNLAKDIPEAYRRYLVNSLRESFKLPSTPIRLLFKGSKNPFIDKKD